MTFFKHNIWNVLVGTVKRDKNLQLQRISRMSKQCFQNAALTGVQKATENSLCGCLFVYLFIYLYLKLLSFLLLGKLSNSFFPYGRLSYTYSWAWHISNGRFFSLDPGGKMFSARLFSAPELLFNLIITFSSSPRCYNFPTLKILFSLRVVSMPPQPHYMLWKENPHPFIKTEFCLFMHALLAWEGWQMS